MANSGFATRKQEQDYDRGVAILCELLCDKVVELVKVLDEAGIDPDECPSVPTQKHIKWTSKFFEAFRSIYKLEKGKYQEPKLVAFMKPLATFLHGRQKKIIMDLSNPDVDLSSAQHEGSVSRP